MTRFSQWLVEYRRPIVILAHVVLWTAAYAGAFLLRFDFDVPAPFTGTTYAAWVLPLIVLRAIGFEWFGLFHGMWKYTGQRDLEDLLKATLVPTVLFALAVL